MMIITVMSNKKHESTGQETLNNLDLRAEYLRDLWLGKEIRVTYHPNYTDQTPKTTDTFEVLGVNKTVTKHILVLAPDLSRVIFIEPSWKLTHDGPLVIDVTSTQTVFDRESGKTSLVDTVEMKIEITPQK